VTFIHTTWDRFTAAEELNDLYAEGDEFVDRVYHALRDADLPVERYYPVKEAGVEYAASLALPCQVGVLEIEIGDGLPNRGGSLLFTPDAVASDLPACLEVIQAEVQRRGGVQPYLPCR
jgi:hypothetical protein